MTGVPTAQDSSPSTAVLPGGAGARPWLRETIEPDVTSESDTPRLRSTLGYLRARVARVAAIMLLAGIAGGSVALLLPPTYTARASFFSEGKQSELGSGLSGMGTLLPLLALAGGALDRNESAFFVDLLKSQAFLDSLAASRISTGGSQTSVEDYVVRRARDASDRRWKARKSLRRMLSVTRLPAGVVLVEVRAKSPVAAADMANRSVDLVDEFNVHFRQQQAAARRRHTESFLNDVEARLRGAEVQLEQFLLANRSVLLLRTTGQSPVLQQRAERLRSEVLRLATLKEQLATSVENARLTELNDAPVVVQIDHPAPPERRTGPPRLLITIGAMLLAGALIFWVAYIRAPRVIAG